MIIRRNLTENDFRTLVNGGTVTLGIDVSGQEIGVALDHGVPVHCMLDAITTRVRHEHRLAEIRASIHAIKPPMEGEVEEIATPIMEET